jgi:hypothetical protein
VNHSTAVTIAVVVLAAAGWSQEADNAPTPAFGAEIPYTETLTPPLPVSGLQMPLAFSSENPRSNYVSASLRFALGYDDNILATPNNRLSDISYVVMPNLTIGQTRERWQWKFGYGPGLTINQKLSEQNQAAHNLDWLFAYQLSPHVTAQINEHFEKTNSTFSGLLGSAANAGPGPLQQPNSSVITPLADRTGNTTGLDLRYQFSASSLVGASGSFYFANYNSPAGTTNLSAGLVDTRAWGGDAFYARRFSSRHWVGLTYNFQRLLFDPGNRTDVSRTLLFYSFTTGPRLSFSFWAGPEQTSGVIPIGATLANSAASREQWNAAGGADVTLQGRFTSFRVGYSRQTSDGGGLAQAVRLQQVSGEVKRRLTQRWTTSVSIGYGKNRPLATSGSQPPYNGLLGNASVDCQLTGNLGFGLRYGRDQLTYEYPSSSSVVSNRNRAWFSISYSFVRPLGR